MSCKEDQEEEIEVLESIYDGDSCFKAIDATTYQYKIGEDGNYKSYVLEVRWADDYPEAMPNISMDAFYNKHILPEVKEKVVSELKEQCEMLLGCAMTYTLFEYAKENGETLMADQPDAAPVTQTEEKDDDNSDDQNQDQNQGKKKVKKEQLTKSQKRKQYNRLDNAGQMPRGYDWVDIIKHLSQTGGKDECS